MPAPPPADIPAVVARLEAVAGACAPGDGVGWFARLYLQVTRSVAQEVGRLVFRDPRFLIRLDVVFAGLFFSAADAAAGHGRVPPAWQPLFEARGTPGIAGIQFALAGMNAHINRDLPIALVTTCTELHVPLGGPEHADYLRVNGVLASVEPQLKQWFATGVLGDVDHLLGKAGDRIAMWDVERARDFAWTQAQTLWALRGEPVLRDAYVDGLDHVVGLAGRGLLLPVA